MQAFLKYMNEKLIEREQQSKLRGLKIYSDKIDFSSNDYLGIAKVNNSGSTGSRLISGNNKTPKPTLKILQCPSFVCY